MGIQLSDIAATRVQHFLDNRGKGIGLRLGEALGANTLEERIENILAGPIGSQARQAGAADPAHVAWRVGLVACLGSGLIELGGALVAEKIRKATPRAALLSTLAGIALTFISLGFLFRTYARPVVGLVTFGIIMLVYFEKPLTTVGWKGLINDPMLDGSFHINHVLRLARKVLLDLTNMGIPTATEFLDLITPQYVTDLISWGAIGARTTESQVHRELASGLSCPVGFKNSTDGGLQNAMDAIRAASQPHHFLSMTMDGKSAIFSTTGNEDGHIILRGGVVPNYDRSNVREAEEKLESYGMTPNVMVDCSHANSMKQPEKQVGVASDIADQISAGDKHIIGVMIESHINAGRQDIEPGKELKYGVSITDACIGWEDSEMLLREIAEAVKAKRKTG